MNLSTAFGFLLAACVLSQGWCAESSVGASVPESFRYTEKDSPTCKEGEGECLESKTKNDTEEEVPIRILQDNTVETFYGVPQNVSDKKHQAQVIQLLQESHAYMKQVQTDPKFESVKDTCKNQHESCSFWSTLGECEANPAYMKVNCAPACKSCMELSFEARCPFDPSQHTNVFDKPGDVNAMFERIMADPDLKELEPRVLARPDPGEDEEGVIEGPWMIQFDNFLSPQEADRLIQLGTDRGYERSSEVGKKKIDGTYDNVIGSGRTSENSWCQGACETDPMTKDVVARIEQVTHVPYNNSEYLQMLRYEEGQFYDTHHDLIEYQRDRAPGVRILTLYMYLNDVEEGGGTEFPRLNGGKGVTVIPKKGRAVLWPSVLNEDPHKKDPLTHHTALPVIKGVKYGANAWLHQRDFKTPNFEGCS